MKIVGITELVCVFLLMIGNRMATWVLLVIMIGALYMHFSVGDDIKDMNMAFVGLGSVLVRLYTMNSNSYVMKWKIN